MNMKQDFTPHKKNLPSFSEVWDLGTGDVYSLTPNIFFKWDTSFIFHIPKD